MENGKTQSKIFEIEIKQTSSGLFACSPKLFLSNNDGWFWVSIAEIIYCESDNAYTTFHLVSKDAILITRPLKYFETLLLPFDFVRIHQSTLVNVQHLYQVKKAEVGCVAKMKNGKELTIARMKKKELLLRLESLSITNKKLIKEAEVPPVVLKQPNSKKVIHNSSY